MNGEILRTRSLSVKVRRVTIRGTSSLEAQRLADALLPALERAFGAARDDALLVRPSRGAADHVSKAVRDAVTAKLERQR
ncbi:hypothetical protein [Paraburkholderia caribensis]|uniref:hypothetical protein n=1 Tax=Paraburkholderia caribensis TaxID=75105 RepID=UPI001D06650D|nr:hypothetical protein [Paraburkholderia caribensis]